MFLGLYLYKKFQRGDSELPKSFWITVAITSHPFTSKLYQILLPHKLFHSMSFFLFRTIAVPLHPTRSTIRIRIACHTDKSRICIANTYEEG